MAKQLNKAVNGRNQINFSIGFDVDKTSINEIKNALSDLQKMTGADLMNLDKTLNLDQANQKLKDIRQTATTIKQALISSFNQDLGSVNIAKFNAELGKTNLDLKQIAATFSAAGKQGETALRGLATELLTTNKRMKETHNIIQDMANTMANTVKWSIASSAMNSFTGSVSKAYGYVKKLDTSLNNIMIVTNKSSADMEKFAKQANKAAQELGAQTTAYTDAALIYYQQGLSDDQVKARAETTVKVSNVTGMSGSEASEALTAVWNGYRVQANETELYIDKLAKVAAGTAADLEELSTGMSKVASAANTAGVDIDQLNATLATVISVTREAPETIGSAFKTIYARLGDLKLNGQDEYGVTLGNVSGKLHELGIEILDEKGNMRDMGDIIEDTAAKWDTWTQAQKQAAAVAMAGKMQYSRLIALFENWDMYTEALNMSKTSVGELQKEQDTYMESTEAHLTKMTASFENLYSSILDPKSINAGADALGFMANRLADLIDGLGGGAGLLLNLGSVGMRVFSQQLAGSIATTITNIQTMNQNLAQTKAETALLNDFKGIEINDKGYKKLLEMKEEVLRFGEALSAEEQQEANAAIKRYNEILNEKDAIEQAQQEATEYLDILSQTDDSINQARTFSRDSEGKGSINFYNEANENEKEDVKFGDTDYNVYTDALEKQENSLKKVHKELKSYASQIETVNKIHDEAISKTEEETKAEDALRESLKKVVKETRALTKDTRLTKEQQEELKTAVENYMQQVNGKGIDPTVATNLGQNLIDAYDKAVSHIEQKTQEVKQTIDNSINGVGRAATENAKSAENAWNTATEKMRLEAQIKGVLDFAGSLGQVATAITSITSLIDIWNSKELSGGEKLIKTVETVAMTLPMVVSGIGGIIKALPAMAAAFVPTFASMAAAEQTVGAAASVMWTEILWPIAPIILAIAGLGLAIYGLVKVWNADADAAKEANEQAKQAAAEAEEAKNAYEELGNTLEKYRNAAETLKTLKENTEEYKKALREANDAALDLIKSDGELAKHAEKRNGRIVFLNDKGEEMSDEEISNRARTKMYESAAISNVAQINANNAQLKSERTNFLRSAGLSFDEKAITAAIVSGVAPYTAPLAASMVALSDSISDDELEKVTAQIIADGGEKVFSSNNVLRESLEKLSFLNEDEIEALINEKDALQELVRSTDQLNETNKLLLQQSLEDSLETDKDYAKLDDDQKKAVAALYGKGLDAADEDELRRQAKEKWYQDAAFGGGNEDAVHAEYAKRKGWTLSADKLGDKAVYVDEKGEEHTVEDDTARAYLVNSDVQKNLKDYDKNGKQKIINAVTSLDAKEAGQKYGADFQSAVLSSVASGGKLTDEIMQPLFADLSPTEMAKVANWTGEDWKKALNLTDEEMKTLGLESGNAWAEKFAEAAKNYEWDPGAAVRSAMNKKEGLDLKENGLDEKEFAGYAEHLMDVADASDEMADAMAEDADAAIIVTKAIMRMNQGIEKLAKGQEEWIDVLKNSSKTSEEYYEALTNMQDALADILDTDKKFVSDTFVQEHLEDIQKAAEGDAEAIDRLHKALAVDMVAHIAVDNNLDESQVQSLIDQVQGLEIPNIEVGSSIDFTKFDDDTKAFLDKMMDIVQNAHMTAEEANAFFAQMGFEPNFDVKEETVTDNVPVTVTESEITSVFPLKMKSRSYQDGVEPVTRTIQVPSLSASGENNYKGIKGITRKPGGSFNNYSSKNKGGGSPGGGKSGGGSKSEPSKKDLNEDKVDRYEKVNVQLELIEDQLKKIQSQEKKLIGQKLIDNLNKQLELLNKKIDKTNEKMQIARGEQAELQRELASYGVTFDADGVMSNYAQVFATQQAVLNNLYNQYNNMSADAQKGFEETLEAAEKKWNRFKEAVSEYDQLIGSTIPGLENDIRDALDEQIELKIKEFDMEIELSLDIKAAQDKWNEFRKNIIKGLKDDDILGNALENLERFADYYNEAGNGIVQKEANYLTDLMKQIDQYNETGWSDWYGNDEASMMEHLRQYYEQTFDDLQNVKDLIDEIHDAINETLEDVADQMDEQMEYYETISDILEHDMKMVELVYGEDAFDRLELYYQEQEDNYNRQLEFQRMQVDFWRQQMDTLEEGSEEWETAKENWLNAVKEWQGTVEEAIENLEDEYLNTINKIFKSLNDQVTGGLGLGYVEAQWDLINKHADEYLDTINATYGIQQLQNKYLDAMNNTDNVGYQRKLNDLMKAEVADLKTRDQLTQYDLDRAELKYQIALKQIALQEAQQNKSTMRLRRDSQGNYTYQYVSDDDQVQKAQEEISNLYNELYNLDVDRFKENLDNYYELWTEFQEKMKETSAIKDEQKQQEMQLLLVQQYGDLINGVVAQNEQIKQNLQEATFLELEDLYGKESEMVQQFLENQDDAMSLLVDGWSSALQEMANQVYADGGFEPTYEQALADIKDATDDYQVSLGELKEAAKTTFDTIGTEVDEVQKQVEELTKDTNTLKTTYEQAVTDIANVYKEVQTLNNYYEQQATAIDKAREAYEKYIQKMREAQAAANNNTGGGGSGGTSNPSGGSTGSGGSRGGGAAANPNRMPSVGQTVTYTGGYYYGDSYGGSGRGSRGPGKQVTVTIVKNDGRPYPIHVQSSDSAYGWLKKEQLAGYDTGGYTGTWGVDGKLAMLHEKELVLNKQDTENLLNSVEIMRNVTNSLGSSILKSMSELTSNGLNIGSGGEIIEQQVHIDAQFPNVKDSREIENALNNLVNAAAQRVNKR